MFFRPPWFMIHINLHIHLVYLNLCLICFNKLIYCILVRKKSKLLFHLNCHLHPSKLIKHQPNSSFFLRWLTCCNLTHELSKYLIKMDLSCSNLAHDLWTILVPHMKFSINAWFLLLVFHEPNKVLEFRKKFNMRMTKMILLILEYAWNYFMFNFN